MNTTLYNHAAAGTKEKPLISNADFKQLFNDVKAGNRERYAEVLKTYSLAPCQHSMIQVELIYKAMDL